MDTPPNPLRSSKLSKRKFLITTTTAAAAICAWEPLVSVCRGATVSKPRRLTLNGNWQVAQAGENDWIAATVPGCVHTDLLAAGKIPDPFYRDNEKSVQWVGKSNWLYKRAFEVPEEVIQSDRVLLRCEGLDTLACVKINGREIGKTDNMFRTWEFDVKPALNAGQNTIEILFTSPYGYMEQREHGPEPDKFVKERAWVRKEPCSFGWDWGPVLPSCGIWRNIRLEAFNQARIDNVLIEQNHDQKDRVRLDVHVAAEIVRPGRPLKAQLTVRHDGRRVATTEIEMTGANGRGSVEVKHPKLWWPAGMGEQALYEVQIELADADGNALDTTSRRIGLRTLKMTEATPDKPLFFEVNGVPFFAKGANWIPADSFPNRVKPDALRRYMADAAAVNMNFLRFWGGGYYEDDALFDACDELGLCIWLDFKFACAAYPAFDPGFMESVKHEASDNLQRLRHHPCIAVWCGNNEISLLNMTETWTDDHMSRADYQKLFKELLAQQVKAYAPEANYVSGSPDCGDTHYWQVWHGPAMFEAYREQSGFMSEFGYQSFPEPKTVRAFTNEADRAAVTSPVMRWHQRSNGSDGNQRMVDMIQHYFNPPKDFDTTLWLSQITQAHGIKMGAEHWRQTMPQSMGCVFWQYNDTWPGMSWSSVDYFGRWKALHYAARKFYAPILVSGLEHPQNGTIDIFVTSDLLKPRRGKLTWNVTNLDGQSLARESMHVELPAQKSALAKTIDLGEHVRKLGASGLLAWLQLDVDGKTVSENLVTLTHPKELKLTDPQLSTKIEKSRDDFQVTIESKKPALWTWFEIDGVDARFSDNFFHLKPNAPERISVEPSKPLSHGEFEKALRIRNLFDACLPA
ncbi:MAG TPA: glycoside hydrolase family 2 protein [Verrucomicrobiae bacterium]|nr:glycoside hydrolase family 2 protein [Verrucomicrobiae bacterium]